jgi:glutathione S-transferase
VFYVLHFVASSIVELYPSCHSPWRLTRRARADEVDPYKKPAELLEVSPKGLVPALKLHTYTPPRALNESTVILEYLEEYVQARCHRIATQLK